MFCFGMPRCANATTLQDVENLKGFAQNKIIFQVILLTWFAKSTSDGVRFCTYFSPISLETWAFVISVVSINSYS